MPSQVLEVTMAGEPVFHSSEGTRPLTAEEFGALLGRVADCVHDEVDNACVSGQADVGKVEVWFLVPDAPTFHGGLRRATEVIAKITQVVEQEAGQAIGAPDPQVRNKPGASGLVRFNHMYQQCKEISDTALMPV